MRTVTTPKPGRVRDPRPGSSLPTVLGLDLEDARTFAQLVAGAVIVVGAAATLGLAVRLFIAAAGIGG